MKRIEREIRTLGIMIDMFCRRHHGTDRRCDGCRTLYEYARQRALKCTFGEDKPVCSKCSIHCYKPDMRGKIKEVMKFAGPKMISSHPILALRHLMSPGKAMRAAGKNSDRKISKS